MAPHDPTGFVGRHAERGRLAVALGRARQGLANTVLVTGEAGIGKTALLHDFLETHQDDVRVLAVSCAELDQHAEWGVINRLVPGVAPPRAEPFRAGTDLLVRVADQTSDTRPLVLMVDDCQWADPLSLQALAFLAQRLHVEPVLLCLVCRSGELSRLPPAIIRQAGETGRIELSGMEAAEIADLARDGYDVDLGRSAAERLGVHTGGNPLHLRTLLATVPADVLASRSELPVPSSFSTLLKAQIDACSPPARKLLDALAVLGHRGALPVVAAVADVPDASSAADELAAAGLIELDLNRPGRRVSMRHGLIGAGVLAELSLAERVRLHASAATVLEGHEALRHRLAAADAPNDALQEETRAWAATLAAAGQPTVAAQLLTSAAELLPPGTQRTDLILQAGRLLLEAGGSLTNLMPEIETYDAGPARDFLVGRAAFEAGDVDTAGQLLDRAWRAEPTDLRLAASIADTQAVLATSLARYGEIATWARRALAGGQGSLNSAVMLFYGAALDRSPGHAAEELQQIVAASDESDGRTGARLALGMCLAATNDLEHGRAELAAVSVHPAVRGSLQAYVNSRSFLAETLFRAGSWKRALDLALATSSVVDDADARWLAPLPHGLAATILAATGEFDAARASVRAAATAATGAGVQAELWAQVAELRLAEAQGDNQTVVTIGDQLDVPGIRDLPDWVQRRRPAYAAALVAQGRSAEAARVLDRIEAEVRLTGDLSLAAEAARVRGQWCEAAGDHEGARETYRAGLELDPVTSRPFERARLELAAGARHRRAGERRTAAALLETAAERFRALGSPPWLDRCERELVACGLTPVRRSAPPVTPALTPQERVISHLVASGLTNREVADELVLSPKTVEFHLGRVYRKLGIRSRSQLTALVSRDAVPPP